MTLGGDPYRQIGGVREPDPTLGKNLGRHAKAQAGPVPPTSKTEPVPSGALPDDLPEPEHHSRPRRQRVVLSGPKQTNALRARVELEEQTSWGELLIKDLVKKQLRTGLALGLLVVVLLGALPLAFFLSPDFAGLRLIGVPVAWLLLGVVPFPLLLAVGLWYNRLAERHERAFVDMIED
ncbi:hypothetical protein [Amycolatopsis magusensis]|uniref:DUF485 domain-containing protein n=1 Tax=Amycolatopsis magusensis TaxID=882444 RepID=A0ABS4PJN4_9PSEU|nr:hypothetical protein [Amycolatopsis magusensis]MBP2179605.1 hypothetical protein [Amycolatopsis magusensis]MDI5979101.1 hypothetical protein [Amycolatopsis magusensis]